ncbi:hypothetical protein BCR33DRAFT_724323 [Rhizoclosmatium globosum]|uniref:Uncharacterized protein n=1 Tax=Rhizoclosmatium globosum TaxID=329046 RepID=A0A1Y2B711_9FUNG|nr:hypothetical protein BCR33DRAFT_724323 [Rhizoclosmatium globosum]|eukprot:ORY30514.1 hypothetical protein BCR33DRAFT_724323 [Rhizoclosmatium globosum]
MAIRTNDMRSTMHLLRRRMSPRTTLFRESRYVRMHQWTCGSTCIYFHGSDKAVWGFVGAGE